MRVLGIDPGLATLGYGVLEGTDEEAKAVGFGVLTTPASLPTAERLLRLYEGVTELLHRYEPAEVAVEAIGARNLRSAVAVGQARGISLLAAAGHDLPVFEYTPLKVKQTVTGYGRGEKAQVQEMVRLQLHLASIPQPDDAADALAVALCHLQVRAFTALIDRSRGTP